jgi:hypothetical protein
MADGAKIEAYCTKQNKLYAKSACYSVFWEGLQFCVLNVGQLGSRSQLFEAGAKLTDDALFAWCPQRPQADGTIMVKVSLFHNAQKRTDLDLSQIARKYGGGGHRGACGFSIPLTQLLPIISQAQL